MWRQANLKAIIDHQPPWLVWLQCTRCNWLGTAIRFFNRKYTLSLSITLKRWQHQGKTKLPEATVWCKNWINCGCQSNSDRRNQARRVSPKLHRHLQSSLKCTTVSVYWASCCEFLETSIKRNSVLLFLKKYVWENWNNCTNKIFKTALITWIYLIQTPHKQSKMNNILIIGPLA